MKVTISSNAIIMQTYEPFGRWQLVGKGTKGRSMWQGPAHIREGAPRKLQRKRYEGALFALNVMLHIAKNKRIYARIVMVREVKVAFPLPLSLMRGFE